MSFFSRARLSFEQKQRIRQWWLTIAFVSGFALDAITLGRVDQWFAMALLGFHMGNAGANLALLYAGAAGRLPTGIASLSQRLSPLLVQFSFGSLLSGTLVFYAQSGSWSVSWPFLLMVLAVMVGNEVVRDRTRRLIFNLAIFFLGISSFTILFMPIMLGAMGAWVFLASSVTALAVMGLYIKILRRIIPNFLELHMRGIIFVVGMIFCTLQFLYFSALIPPIPLSLKHIDIYHHVERTNDGYRLTFEPAPWYKFWREANTVYHRRKGESVFCFASVFAPTDFSPLITHRWEVYDEERGSWQTHSTIVYPIEGGADRGYRGYSEVAATADGLWRCTVETERGQAIGRETFRIIAGEPRLVTVRE